MALPTLFSDATYIVAAKCPHCGIPTEVPITLTTLLKQTQSKSQISVTLSQEPVSHSCQQTRIPEAVAEAEAEQAGMLPLPYVDHESGEIVGGTPDDVPVLDDIRGMVGIG